MGTPALSTKRGAGTSRWRRSTGSATHVTRYVRMRVDVAMTSAPVNVLKIGREVRQTTCDQDGADRGATPRVDAREERRELSLFPERVHHSRRQQQVRQDGAQEQHQRDERERATGNRAEDYGRGIREGTRGSGQPGRRAYRHELNQDVHGRHYSQGSDHPYRQVPTRVTDLPRYHRPQIEAAKCKYEQQDGRSEPAEIRGGLEDHSLPRHDGQPREYEHSQHDELAAGECRAHPGGLAYARNEVPPLGRR